ncbi:helix-turn-helix domain-containing protein [Frankia sp. AgB32]|uniref:TetR/AcrR family transcriptional regulator n=1 Tax=Frankia sp. AgB32 TaxID=631119 RepID=UPI0027E2AA57|nr:helix-turn-helix domain-containing protein [Frankia sp. AgB32]
MSADNVSTVPWVERAVDRSPTVQRSRTRSMQQATNLVEAAERLIATKGARFTTQELVKEAGVAMQTFYRHFAGKDQLLLAVVEDLITREVAGFQEAASGIADPLSRLRSYIVAALTTLGTQSSESAGSQFITTEHWRLHQQYPEEMAHATRPFADLVAGELDAARQAGLLDPSDVEQDAELVARLVMSVYHHYAFATAAEPMEVIGERLWRFCLRGLGGNPSGDGA